MGEAKFAAPQHRFHAPDDMRLPLDVPTQMRAEVAKLFAPLSKPVIADIRNG